MNNFECYSDQTVLVTGGLGAIGSRLAYRLSEVGAKVLIIDDLSSGFLLNKPDDATLIQGDLGDSNVIKEAFEYNPETIFHFAAFFANQNSVENPLDDLYTNGHATLKLFDKCASYPSVSEVVYASSSCVYSDQCDLPYSEEDKFFPSCNTPYEITKCLGEQYCKYYNGRNSTNFTSGRIFNSYGPGEMPGEYRNVIPNFIYRALRGEKLPITGTGEETRDFTFIDDVIRGFLLIGSQDTSHHVYNLATGSETRIDDLAQTINEVTDNSSGVEYYDRREWDETDRRHGDISRAKQDLGYQPTVELEEGLSRTVEWFVDNWETIHE